MGASAMSRIPAKIHKIAPLGFIQCFEAVPKGDRIKVLALLFVQCALSVLDLLGVVAIGLLGVLSISGIQSRIPTGKVATVLEILGLTELSFQQQASVIASFACAILLGRTIFSMYLTRRSLFFLSHQGSRIAAELFSGTLTLPYLVLKQRNSQEVVYAINAGCNAITIGVIGSTLNFFADLALVFILFSGLAILDISIAISTLMAFSLVALFLYLLMQKRADILSEQYSELTIIGNIKIVESLNSFRELFVKNREEYYSQFIQDNREEIASSSAELSFMPNVSKYTIEVTMVLGIFILGAIQFALKDAAHAVGTISVFLAASTRLAPAILRMQQNAITLRSSLTVARPALELAEDVSKFARQSNLQASSNSAATVIFENEIVLKNLSFQFSDSNRETISNINLVINQGEFIAITGPSGAGKTTLVDLILGLIDPTSGSVSISGVSPKTAFRLFEKRISYVPQDIEIFEGSIRANILLGYEESEYSDAEVEDALRKAQLWDFVNTLPSGMHTQVGDRGTRLSGGQRQRLGIARGIISAPKLLILDEATSALDSETESVVANTIYSLRESCTLIVIAHRLSTVRNANKVLYLENGQLIASGSFEDVRSQVTNFENQAKLMGL
jgi:ABC-type multidrug transport system fused ATPase/permease subunit